MKILQRGSLAAAALALGAVLLTGCGAPAAPTTTSAPTTTTTATTDTTTTTPTTETVDPSADGCELLDAIDGEGALGDAGAVDPNDIESVQQTIDAIKAVGIEYQQAATQIGDPAIADAAQQAGDAYVAYAELLNALLNDPTAIDDEAFSTALTDLSEGAIAVATVCP